MKSPGNTISTGHRGPAVDIAVWISFIISGIAIFTKVLTKLGRHQGGNRRFGLGSDDLVFILTLLFAAGQSLCVSRQVAAGLGTFYERTQASHGASYQKSGYASQLLYVVTLGLAKLSTFVFAFRLDAVRTLKQVIYTEMVLTALWFLSSVLLVAFQCQGPSFWAIYSGNCISQPAAWTYIETGNALIDVLLAVTLCILVRAILKTRTKYILWIVFAARGLSIPAAAVRLFYLYQRNYGRIGHEEADLAISTAVAMNTTVLITCVPFLKPLMEQLQPGWSTSDIRHGVGYNVAYQCKSVIIHSDRFPSGSVVASSVPKSKHKHNPSIMLGCTLESIELEVPELQGI